MKARTARRCGAAAGKSCSIASAGHWTASGPATAALFDALGDPTRRAIVGQVAHGLVSVSALARPLGISITAVGQHLHVLERAGLLALDEAGPACAVARLQPEGLRAIETWAQTWAGATGKRGSTGSRRADELEDRAPGAPLPRSQTSGRDLVDRRLVNLTDRLAECGIEFRVAHLLTQILQQRAAEAGDHAAILRQFPAGVRPAAATGKRHHAQHAGMIDQRVEQAGRFGNTELQHELVAARHGIQSLEEFLLQDLVGTRRASGS